jgi:hypothetical protein
MPKDDARQDFSQRAREKISWSQIRANWHMTNELAANSQLLLCLKKTPGHFPAF